MTTTAHDYPAPEQVAALRAREPGTVLLFRVAGDRFAAIGDDGVAVEGFLRGVAPSTTYFEHGTPTWVTFKAAHLEPLLAAIVADGGRAAVCERAEAKGTTAPVERVATEGGGA